MCYLSDERRLPFNIDNCFSCFKSLISIFIAAKALLTSFNHITIINNLEKKLNMHTCEPSGGSIFLPILRVPPVNFQNLPPVKKFIQVQKNLDLHFAINISGNSPFGTPTLMKNAERYKW